MEVGDRIRVSNNNTGFYNETGEIIVILDARTCLARLDYTDEIIAFDINDIEHEADY